ncbi:hypothetical protein EVAR_26762_1 [Eumeta japonica]|uniref:Uncharacterized protein n=1 Tax=Eumeta variegata TaxID=151549 RepID=A0A4C1XEK1_EUMVA|nr:hypothetical protein EVAR_26762_1 [Eumeta japonica]
MCRLDSKFKTEATNTVLQFPNGLATAEDRRKGGTRVIIEYSNGIGIQTRSGTRSRKDGHRDQGTVAASCFNHPTLRHTSPYSKQRGLKTLVRCGRGAANDRSHNVTTSFEADGLTCPPRHGVYGIG